LTPTADLPLEDSASLKTAVTPLARNKPGETVELKLSVLPVNGVSYLNVKVLTASTLLRLIAAWVVSNTKLLDAVGSVSVLQLVAVTHWLEAPPSHACAHALALENPIIKSSTRGRIQALRQTGFTFRRTKNKGPFLKLALPPDLSPFLQFSYEPE
jgi:hypothetical protein